MQTELKTLKDIKSTCFDEDYNWDENSIHKNCELINVTDLRQEAIKWIKHFKKESYRDYGNESKGAITFITTFFNITDKEIKEHS